MVELSAGSVFLHFSEKGIYIRSPADASIIARGKRDKPRLLERVRDKVSCLDRPRRPTTTALAEGGFCSFEPTGGTTRASPVWGDFL